MRLVLDIGGTKIAAAHVADGLLQDRRQLPMPATEAEFMQAIASLAAGRPPIGSAAVAVTGYTDGTLVRGINWKTIGFWDGFPLVPRLVDLLGCPVTVLNDAQAAAWAEYEARRHEVKDLLFITLSTGVGGGLVLDGRLREGRQGLAGHVGHMAFDVMPWMPQTARPSFVVVAEPVVWRPLHRAPPWHARRGRLLARSSIAKRCSTWRTKAPRWPKPSFPTRQKP
jgi:N-acylmannosamine kinase